MTWQTKYTQVLNTNNPLTLNYNYVIEIPAIDFDDIFIRLALRPSSSGSARVQAMYVGHGSGYSFDGAQVPVTVNGNANFTLSGTLTYSDPIPVASFGFDRTKKLLLSYELLNGDSYRGAVGLATDFKLHYKIGIGEAGATSKSGYTTLSNRTAMLEAVQFVDVVPPIDEEQNEDEGEYVVNSAKQVLDGERHSTGGEVVGVANMHTHIQFKNPIGSGKIGLLYEVEIFPEADTIVTMRSTRNTYGTAFPVKCNLFFNFGAGSMEGRYANLSAIEGVFHSIHKLKGGQRNTIKLDVPLVACLPDIHALIAFHTKGVGGVVNIQWREIPSH